MAFGAQGTIVEWTPHNIAEFGRVPLQFRHDLHRHPLFAEPALVKLLGSLRREDYYVNTMDTQSYDERSRREGQIEALSGEEVLQAVRTGVIWILLLQPHKADARYRDLLHEIYAEFVRTLPSFKPSFPKMTVVISSPNVQVHYHCDMPGQTLWQVQGHKRVYVYPNRQPFLPQGPLEKIALGEAHEISLPYEAHFDEHARIYELHAGEMLHWPLNSPHRIVNGDCLNISFTTEHFTPSIRRSFYVNYANGVLRRLGVNRLSQRTTGAGYWVKLGLAATYKLSGAQKKRRKVMRIDFTVDPRAPQGVRSIPACELRL
jgi:hypothetical protein